MRSTGTIHSRKSMLFLLMTVSDTESGNLFSQSKLLSEKSDKRYSGSSKYEEDHSCLYFSQTHRGLMCKICEKYPYCGGSSKGPFSTRACENTTHPSHAFRQHERSERHIRLEKKQSDLAQQK